MAHKLTPSQRRTRIVRAYRHSLRRTRNRSLTDARWFRAWWVADRIRCLYSLHFQDGIPLSVALEVSQ